MKRLVSPEVRKNRPCQFNDLYERERFTGGTVVVQVDGQSVGNGKPGPVCRQVYEAYQE